MFAFLCTGVRCAARAQNNNPGSLKTFSVRVQRILDAQSAAVCPSSSTASRRALHFDTRKRANSDRLCLAAAWRGVAPPNRVDVALALAPRVTNNFATASWPATMAACKAGTSVAGAATTGHSGMASTSQQARSAFAPKSKSCCATRAWPPTAALATPKLRTLSPASLNDSRASVKARSGARPDAAASTTCAGGENFKADATRNAAACVRRFPEALGFPRRDGRVLGRRGGLGVFFFLLLAGGVRFCGRRRRRRRRGGFPLDSRRGTAASPPSPATACCCSSPWGTGFSRRGADAREPSGGGCRRPWPAGGVEVSLAANRRPGQLRRRDSWSVRVVLVEILAAAPCARSAIKKNAPNTLTCSSFKSRAISAFSAFTDLTISLAISASCFAAANSLSSGRDLVAHFRDRVLGLVELVAQVRFRLLALALPGHGDLEHLCGHFIVVVVRSTPPWGLLGLQAERRDMVFRLPAACCCCDRAIGQRLLPTQPARGSESSRRRQRFSIKDSSSINDRRPIRQ